MGILLELTGLLDVLKPTEELRSSFKFKFYLLVSKIYKVNFYFGDIFLAVLRSDLGLEMHVSSYILCPNFGSTRNL